MKLLLSGALGKMGKAVRECAAAQNISITAGVDCNAQNSDCAFPVYEDFASVAEEIDCIIDFSAPAALDGLLAFAAAKNAAVVLCTTGYNEAQIAKINKHAENHAVFRSANMSLGANVLIELSKKAMAALGGYDVEIIEKHHNRKTDAPSGTALMMADAIREVCPEKYNVYGRAGAVGKRKTEEIGIHALRGGNIVGEHEIIFAGQNETVTIKHEAASRSVFAEGALKAAAFISQKTRGLYDMRDVIKE